MARRRHNSQSEKSFWTTLAALSAFFACPAAASESVSVKYALTMIGLPLGVASAEAHFDPEKYSIRLDAKLVGVASMVSSAKGAATASGEIAAGRVAPSAYATTSANSHSSRTVRMSMESGSVSAVSIEPPMQESPGRIPVTPDLERNVVDPVSALVMPVPHDAGLVGPAACDRTIPVFDGWTRFDVKLAYSGSKPLKIHGFDGMVSVCSARYLPVAGHRPGAPGVVFMENNKQLEIWLAPLEGPHLELPVRISVATMVGTTVVQATELTVREDAAQVQRSETVSAK